MREVRYIEDRIDEIEDQLAALEDSIEKLRTNIKNVEDKLEEIDEAGKHSAHQPDASQGRATSGRRGNST